LQDQRRTGAEEIAILDAPQPSKAGPVAATKELFVDAPPATDSEPLYVWTDASNKPANSASAAPLVVSQDSIDSGSEDRAPVDEGLSDPLHQERLDSPLDENLLGSSAPGMAPLSGGAAHLADASPGTAGGSSSQTAEDTHDSSPTSSGPLGDPIRAQMDDAVQQDRQFASLEPAQPITLANANQFFSNGTIIPAFAVNRHPESGPVDPMVNAPGTTPVTFEKVAGVNGVGDEFFYAGRGYDVVLAPQGATVMLGTPTGASVPDMVTMQFIGANPSATLVGTNSGTAASSIFPTTLAGMNSNAAASNNAALGTMWQSVEYQDLYPGITLRFYGNPQNQLEYDFQVAAGADPSAIHFQVSGADHLALDGQGNLQVFTKEGEALIEHAPTLYQQINGSRQLVQGQYVILGQQEVGFAVGPHDSTAPLIIDPILTVAIPPNQVFGTGPQPLDIQIARLDADPYADIVALNADGSVTIALNSGNNAINSVQTKNLGLGPLNGMTLAALGTDAFPDLVVQGPNSISVAHNDGTGHFTVTQTITPSAAGTLAPTGGGKVQMATGSLNGDPFVDLVTVDPGTNEVLVFLGNSSGTLGTPDRYASGASQPVAVVIGDFIGDSLPDLAVGHKDGTVTFFQGLPGGKFVARPDLTVTGLGTLTGMTTGNFDGTGTQIAVSSSTGVTILKNNHSLVQQTNPIVNGDFSAGTTGWSVLSGTVSTSGGFAQFQEDPTSLLSTLKQSFIVPNNPGTLSFDLVSLGLEDPQGGVPDAFEASLLDGAQNSLVPTWESQATSFFNANPGGVFNTASGVTFDGRHVTLDISHLAPGTKASLYFDLIGNPPGTSSVAAVDNVQVSQAPINEAFTASALAGTFGSAGATGIAAADVNGDGHVDLVVTDKSNNQLVVYTGDGAGNFTRSTMDTSSFGSGPQAIAAASLSANAAVADLAVTLSGSSSVLSPLRLDTAPPQVTVLDPAPGQVRSTDVYQITVQFSKAVQDNGPAGNHSVTNPASYKLVNTLTNQAIPIVSVSYNATTHQAILVIAAASAPLADGIYKLTISGGDPDNAILDLSSNRLGGGSDASSTFTVERTAPTASLTFSPNTLWPPNHKFVTIQAQLNIQDAFDPNPKVTLLSITSSEAATNFYQAAIGTDCRTFQLLSERNGDGNGRIYTITYLVQDAAGNGRIVQGFVVVPHDQGHPPPMPPTGTPPGLGGLQSSTITQINNLSFTVGTVVTDSIAQAGQVNVYSFTGAGQQLFFNALSGSGTALHWFVTDPQGNILFSDDFRDHDTITLAQTGTYYLTLDARNGQTSPYQFEVWNVPAPTSTPITVGTPVNGSITVPGSQVQYTFSATAGQRLFFDVLNSASNGLSFSVLGPNNAVVLSASNQNQNNGFTAPSTGTYTVVVKHGVTVGATGAFQFELFNIPADVPQAVGIGAPINGQLTVPGQTETFTFQGNLGQQILFNVVNNAGGAIVFTLKDPAGNAIFANQPGSQTLASLPATGTYTLVASGTGAQVDSFRFQLVDQSAPPAVVPLDPVFQIGDIVSGNITNATVPDVYTFTATAGQQLYFVPLQGGTFSFTWNLTDPSSHTLFSDSFNPEGPLSIAQIGTYTLTVRGLGAYQFQVKALVATPITIGHVVSGAVNTPADAFLYTFNATSGQALGFEASQGSFQGVAWRLTNPNGSIIFDDANFNTQGPLTLQTAGQYQLLVRFSSLGGGGGGDPPFQFAVLAPIVSAPVAIAFGTTISGNLAQPFQTDQYTFNGSAGQSVVLQNLGGSLFSPSYRLLDPNGNFVGSAGSAGNVFNLSQAGQYTLQVSAGASTGTYSFQLSNAIVNPPVAISIGQPVSGATTHVGETNQYSFSGTAGQTIYFYPTSGSDFFTLTDPNGTVLFRSVGQGEGPLVLSQTGTYTLAVKGQQNTTGSYAFEFFNVTPPVPVPLTFGATVNGTIAYPIQQDVYTFSASAGDRFFLHPVPVFTFPNQPLAAPITITAPDGTVIAGPSTSSIGPFTVSAAGTYTVTVTGNPFSFQQTGPYRFYVYHLPPPVNQAITVGQVVTGSISPGQADQYTFSGTAGERLYLNDTIPDLSPVTFTFVRPDGTTFTAVTDVTGSHNLTLDQSGTWTVQVGQGSFVPTIDNYTMQLVSVPADETQTLPLDLPVTAQLSVPAQSIHYLFTGTAGQLFLFDVKNDTGGESFTLTDPSGNNVFANQQTNQVLAPLTVTGTYTLTATALQLNPAPYTIQMQEVRSGNPGLAGSSGTDFWTAYPQNFTEIFGGPPRFFSVFISASQTTSGSIIAPGIGLAAAFYVQGGTSVTVPVPNTLEIPVVEGTTNLGVHIQALGAVSVVVMQYAPKTSDAYLALPNDVLGTQYLVMSYPGFNDSEFDVVATQDQTHVTITPSATTATRPAGVPYTVTLNAGQVYQLISASNGDLTGTSITSDQPIDVLSGSRATQVPNGFPHVNFLVEQIPPIADWGQHFFTVPSATRSADVYRVLASADNTHVTINGTVVATLNRGQFYETMLSQPAEIVTHQPALVAQFGISGTFDNATLGDPEMTLIQPVPQYLSNYILTIPQQGFLANYINVVVPQSALASFTVDGAPVSASQFTAIGNSGYVSAQLAVNPGTHVVAAAQPFGASVYGLAIEDAYGYPGGFSFAQPGQTASVSLTPKTAIDLVGTSDQVLATVTDGSGQPVANTLVAFVVTGANPTSNSVMTDAQGHATFVYAGSHAGTDTVTASVGTIFDTASVNWISLPPTVSFTSPASGATLAAGSQVVLSGLAQPGTPLAPITLVTVNGQAVDGLDVAGDFFAQEPIVAGSNIFTVTATDALGQTATATLTLNGVITGGAPNFSQLQDITGLAKTSYKATTFNRHTNTLYANAFVTNAGPTPLAGPITVIYSNFATPSVSLGNPDGTTPAGAPFITFANQIGPQGLQPGAASAAHAVAFADASQAQVGFAVALLAQGNQPPAFSSAPPTLASVGRAYNYQPTATDPNGDQVSFKLDTAPDGMTINSTTGQITWTPTAVQVGMFQVAIEADDGRGGSAIQQFSIRVTVTAANLPPVFQSLPITSANPGSNYVYAPSVTDADGDSLTFTLLQGPARMTVNSATGQVSYANAVAGSYAVSLKADDGQGGTAVQSWVLSVGAAATDAVAFLSTPSADATVGTPYVYLPKTRDANQQPVSFTLLSGPSGMSIDPNSGKLTWTPTAAQVGPQTIVLSADDHLGGTAVQSFVVNVHAQPPDLAPVITSTPVRIATQGQSYTYQVGTFDADGDPVHFALVNPPVGMSIDASGKITWTPGPADLGFHEITVQALDPAGNAGTQSYFLEVRVPSVAPTVTSTAIQSATAGAPYRYVVTATDPTDGFTFSLVNPPAGMTVDPQTGLVFWTTAKSDIGTHPIDIRITNDRGLTTDQTFTLTVNPDTQPPSVAVLTSTNVTAPGRPFTLTVYASDNVAVANVALQINGVTVALDENHQATYTPTQPGILSIVASATDTSGNVGTATSSVRVIDPTDQTSPVVTITGPNYNDTVSYLTPITGTVTDPDLDFYKVEYALAGTEDWHLITQQTSTGIVNGTLATFDPTMLQNDDYVIRVTAEDVSGNITVSPEITVHVTGNAKVGNFHLEYTDLQVPLAGIPITIKRIYDTLQANQEGDFGFGWSLSIANADIHKTVADDPSEIFPVNSFKAGTKVYLTNPDGVREGFTFKPIEQPGVPTPIGLANPPFGPLFLPSFTPDPGIFDTLSVAQVPLEQAADGTFRLYGTGFPYNPRDFALTTKDGTVYQYNEFAGLQSITDTNGNVLTFSPSGITSSTGQSIQFVRDAQGRITKIIDPAGHSLTYEYDASGNLLSATNQAGVESDYQYATTPAHYLTAANQPEPGCTCQQTASPVFASYDLNGRLISTRDALGNATTQTYDLTHFTEHVADGLGNVTTLVYDANGNVVSNTDPLGNTTIHVFDANNNEVSTTDPRGFMTTRTFDSSGNVTSITDALGHTWTFTYNGLNKLTSATDPLGRVTQKIYDSRGNLIQTIDPAGDSAYATYDSEGRNTSTTDLNGNTTTYVYGSGSDSHPTEIINPDGSHSDITYNDLGLPANLTDENGHTSIMIYNDAGVLLSAADPLGNAGTFTYTTGNQVATFTDPLGRITQYQYDSAGRLVRTIDPAGGVIQRAYNADGDLISETDQLNRTTTYTYYVNRLLASVTDPMGNVTRYQYDADGNRTAITDANGRTTTFAYDPLDRLIKQTNALGGIQLFVYDAIGNLTSFTDENGHTTTSGYDSLNRLVTQVDPLGGVQHWGYDAQGNLTVYTDANGHKTQYLYNSRNKVVEQIDAAGGTQFLTYDAFGNLLSETDELGHTTSHTYDADNRLLATTDPLGGTTTNGYDAVGDLTSIRDALGRTSTFTFDVLRRLISATDPTGATYEYAYDAVGNQTAVTDPLGNTAHSTYNADDELISQTDANGGTWQFTFDAVGNQLTQIDPLGNTTTSTFDALNRLLTRTDANGATVHYGYDAVGNETSFTDALNQTTQFVYNAGDQLTQEIDSSPQHLSRFYGYDLVGNITSITDRDGRVRQFAYDALNQLTDETWWSGSTRVNDIHYAYDAAGNLLTAGDSSSSYAFTYDADNRTTSSDNAGTPGVPHVVLTYGTDAVGNVLSVSDNLGVSVQSTYNGRDQLASQSWIGTGINAARINFTYNLRGDLTHIDRFADSAGIQKVGTSDLSYDPAGNLTQLIHSDSNGVPIAQYAYSYNLAGWLTHETDNGQASDYTYDPTGQLLSATHANQPSEQKTYDLNGNPTGNNIVLGPNNEVISDGTFRYQYDNEGNLIQKTDIATGKVTAFSYDFRNRLTQVTIRDSGGNLLHQENFTYDVFNRRISQTVDGQTMTTVYDGRNAWADFNSAGAVVARYLYGDRLDQLLARFQPGQGTAWYLPDHLGSVRDIVNASGQLIDHIDYNSFGLVVSETNPSAGDRFKFTGREFDPVLAMYYYRARFYDPILGRFINQDPLRYQAGDVNLYRYVGNSPLNATDPSGQTAIIEWSALLKRLAVGAGIGALGGALFGVYCGALEAWARGENIFDGALYGGLKGAAWGAGFGAIGAASAPVGILLAGYGTLYGVGTVRNSATEVYEIYHNGGNILESKEGRVAAVEGLCAAAGLAAGAYGGYKALRQAPGRAPPPVKPPPQRGSQRTPLPVVPDGCFVAGTLVVTGEQSETFVVDAGMEAGGTSDSFNLWPAALCILGGVVAWQVIREKKREQFEEEETEIRDMAFANWGEHNDPDAAIPLSEQSSADRDNFFAVCTAKNVETLAESIPPALAPIVVLEASPSSAQGPLSTPLLKTKAAKRAWRQTAAWSALISGILGALAFLLAPLCSPPAQVAREQKVERRWVRLTKPIEQVRLGNRVLAKSPTGEEDLEFGANVDPPTWREIQLRAAKNDGSVSYIGLLRPCWWLEEQHARVGGTVEMSVPECGIQGRAEVLAITPCPDIERGLGRTVTGVFCHASAHVVHLYVEGQTAPIGTTATHRFWSAKQKAFVRADDLSPGEPLLGLEGQPAVVRLDSSPPQLVYNLEVQGSHVYHISSSGILVHNAAANPPLDWDAVWETEFGLSRLLNGQLRALNEFDIDRYGSFNTGDARTFDPYEGHEILNSKWLEVKGFGARNTEHSANNPAIAVTKAMHRQISNLQIENGVFYEKDLKKLTARKVINKNVSILQEVGLPNDQIQLLKRLTIRHGRAIRAICP
jgi:RHS repeat-associated protein